MKFPFVSRFAFEVALEVSKLARADARDARAALADMTAKYHQLRLQGQTLPEPKPEPPEPKPVDPCIKAINDMTAGDDRLRAAALRQLAQDRANNIPDSEIIMKIAEGMSVYEDEGPII